MARGKKTGGRDFEPGHQYAKNKALPADIKAARKLRTADLENIINVVLYMTDAEREATLADPMIPQITKFVCAIVKRGISDGDPLRLNHLAIWLLGKPDREPPKEVPYMEIHKRDGSVVRL